MLDGELEYHRGNHGEAYVHLRESVVSTIISNIMNLGHGCIHLDTLWQLFWRSRVTTTRPKKRIAKTSV